MSVLQYEMILIAITACCAISAIPLAIISIRRDRNRRHEPPVFEEITLSPLQEKKRDIFIATRVRRTKFGDRRRRTREVTKILRPETEPIPLPEEHVDPV